MHTIEMQEMPEEFFKLWQAAGMHLSNHMDGGNNSWLRAHPYPPFLEHLSFRLGNQLFFIRIEDEDGKVAGPGNPGGLQMIASACRGHACLMPMKKRFIGRDWVPAVPGWGLIDAETRQPIDPVSLVTDEKIEMTHWELHDMAVQVVRTQLEKEGYKIMSWQGNPEVDPAIWFIGASKNPEWVVVRLTKFPENQAVRPANWQSIANGCTHMSDTGHFAPVALVSVDQPFATSDEEPVPLWRGHGMHVRYTGLE